MQVKPELHSVHHPDGTVDTRRSPRVYTHAIVLADPWYGDGWKYGVVGWSQSRANAEKTARSWAGVSARNGGGEVTVVEVQRTGAEVQA